MRMKGTASVSGPSLLLEEGAITFSLNVIQAEEIKNDFCVAYLADSRSPVFLSSAADKQDPKLFTEQLEVNIILS